MKCIATCLTCFRTAETQTDDIAKAALLSDIVAFDCAPCTGGHEADFQLTADGEIQEKEPARS